MVDFKLSDWGYFLINSSKLQICLQTDRKYKRLDFIQSTDCTLNPHVAGRNRKYHIVRLCLLHLLMDMLHLPTALHTVNRKPVCSRPPSSLTYGAFICKLNDLRRLNSRRGDITDNCSCSLCVLQSNKPGMQTVLGPWLNIRLIQSPCATKRRQLEGSAMFPL